MMTVALDRPPVHHNLLHLQRITLERETARRILELYVEGDRDKADELLDEIVQRRREWREE